MSQEPATTKGLPPSSGPANGYGPAISQGPANGYGGWLGLPPSRGPASVYGGWLGLPTPAISQGPASVYGGWLGLPTPCHIAQGLPLPTRACQLAQGLPLPTRPAILHRACQCLLGLPMATGLPTCTGQGRFCYYAGLLLNKRTKIPSSSPSWGYMYPVASCHYHST